MSEFAPVLKLSSLDGSNGFRLDGVAAGDKSGFSVASAGDINGDGFDDLIIGAPYASGLLGLKGRRGVCDVRACGELLAKPRSLRPRRVQRLQDTRLWWIWAFGCFRRRRERRRLRRRHRRRPLRLSLGVHSGASYVVFGTADEFPPIFDSNDALVNGGMVKLDGVAAGDHSGFSVASAGDIDGDGLADLVIGAPQAGTASGRTYVVFGKALPSKGDFFLSSLDGSNGFRLDGAAAGDGSGFALASAGDVNGDGFADLIVGAKSAQLDGIGSGSSYIVFGTRPGLCLQPQPVGAQRRERFSPRRGGWGRRERLFGRFRR